MSQLKITPQYTTLEQKHSKLKKKSIEAQDKAKAAKELLFAEVKNLKLVCQDCGNEIKIGDLEVFVQYYDGYEPGPYESWIYKEEHVWICDKCTAVWLTPKSDYPFTEFKYKDFNSFVKKVEKWYQGNKYPEKLKPFYQRQQDRRNDEWKQFKIREAKNLLETEGLLKK